MTLKQAWIVIGLLVLAVGIVVAVASSRTEQEGPAPAGSSALQQPLTPPQPGGEQRTTPSPASPTQLPGSSY